MSRSNCSKNDAESSRQPELGMTMTLHDLALAASAALAIAVSLITGAAEAQPQKRTVFERRPVGPAWDVHDYYRIVAETAVDGEPLKLDVVVRCATQKIPGRTRRFRIPYLYGLRTKDGGAVIMHLPDLCLSLRARAGYPSSLEHFPDKYLPLMYWTDDADALNDFVAYTAEIGYKHKNSRISRPKVHASPADSRDYIVWKLEHETKNVLLTVPRDPFGSDYDLDQPHPHKLGDPPVGPDELPPSPATCMGMVRLPLNNALRRLAAEAISPGKRFQPVGGRHPDDIKYELVYPEAIVLWSKLAAWSDRPADFGYAHGFPVANARPPIANPTGNGQITNADERVGNIEPTPIRINYSFTEHLRSGARTATRTISFDTTSEAWWGTMLCQRTMSAIGDTLQRDVLIDGQLAFRREPNLLVMDRAGFAWRELHLLPTFITGRVQ